MRTVVKKTGLPDEIGRKARTTMQNSDILSQFLHQYDKTYPSADRAIAESSLTISSLLPAPAFVDCGIFSGQQTPPLLSFLSLIFMQGMDPGEFTPPSPIFAGIFDTGDFKWL